MKAIKATNNNGSIAIQFQLKGRTYKFNPIPGGKYSDPIALGKAQTIAQQIALDIATNEFDPTLSKYKSKTITDWNTTVVNPKGDVTLLLWSKYVEFKRPSVSPSTIAKDYKNVSRYLGKIGNLNSIEQLHWLLENTTVRNAKKVITQLCACADWAVSSQLLQCNGYLGMARTIKLPKGESEETDIDCFNSDEVKSILEGFKTSKHYRHYFPFVQFLFYTGCRPSEAIALTWDSVIDDCIEFSKVVIAGENGNELKDGLKTQRKRRIRNNSQLKDLLKLAKKGNSSRLVFPSPKGTYIDLHNFTNRAWRNVLERQGIRYRKTYQTRHTFITSMLERGFDAKDVAKHCGNSAKTIYLSYASPARFSKMPEMVLELN